jgi:alpha/beta superfamily hydrolase
MLAGRTLIPTGHGQLEAIYRPGTSSAERVALVLHPHPLYGGTMHNPVVFHCARALHEAGYETLRVNFRGVGASSGTHDHGPGETDDARVALDYLLAQQPQARDVVVAGFSFGAGIALRLGCADPRVQRIVAIAAPAGQSDLGFLARCTKAKLFVHGDRDDVAPLALLQDALDRLRVPAAEVRVIAGTGHFFENHLDELRALVQDFAAAS